VRCFICRVIDQEFEPWCVPQAQATTDFTSQEAARTRKSLTHLLRWIFRSKGCEEHAGDAHIGRETHGRYGDVSHARSFTSRAMSSESTRWISDSIRRVRASAISYASPWRSFQRPRDLDSGEALDLVAGADILVVLHADTALHTRHEPRSRRP